MAMLTPPSFCAGPALCHYPRHLHVDDAPGPLRRLLGSALLLIRVIGKNSRAEDLGLRADYPGAVTSPARFTFGVVAIALIVMIVAAIASMRGVLLYAPTAILAIGGIGGFVVTYLTWRRGVEWRYWHGAGWALFVLMTIYAAFAASSSLHT